MATTYLSKTLPASDEGAAWTFSTWIKRGTLSNAQGIFSAGTVSNTRFQLYWANSDAIGLYVTMVGTTATDWETTAKYRDVGAWYHIVMNWNGSAIALYVNGVQVTAGVGTTTGDGSNKLVVGTNIEHKLGAIYDGSWDLTGSMAHTHFCAENTYAASSFGEFDATSGIWVAKTSPSVTYGTNGFFLKYQDTTNFGDDSSGNTNDFTVAAGTMTQTKDSPDNNFCTMNPLDNYYAQYTYSNGNQTITNGGSKGFATGTFALSTGKWYWEMKTTAEPGGAYSLIGISDYPTQGTGASNYLGYSSGDWAYYGIDGNYRNNTSSTSYGDTWASGDIIGVYLDLDNSKLYFAKNGTIQNSGTGISITAAASTTNGFYFPATGYNDTSASVYNHNFGNGYFGTTAVSSAVADAGGEGQFEYDPSSGTFDGSSKDFRAICINNLATYG